MELNPFDLQIQTTASDGKHTPTECVRMAKENGVTTIAITDHDTIGGVAEAVAAGEQYGVEVIPGIEITAQDHNIHILGFGIDTEYPPLVAALAESAQGRLRGAEEMVRRLQADGFVVPWEDVLAKVKGAVVTRPHIVDVILERPENRSKLGNVTTRDGFFREYFSDDSKYYVQRSHISAKDAIVLIHDAGGVAVWSHPPIPDFWEDCAGIAIFLGELVSSGLDGVELFGSTITEPMMQCLEGLVMRYELLITGGSDFHYRYDPEGKPWPRSATTIGEYPTYGRSLDGILERLGAAMEARRRAVASGG